MLTAQARTLYSVTSLLAELNFVPDTVIDIGVAWGTPELYECFPDASYLLVEALPYFEPYLQKILNEEVKGEYILKAVGDRPENRTVYLDMEPHKLAGFGIDWGKKGEACYEISIDTLDNIMEGRLVTGTALVKIDVQGADLAAIRGGRNTIRRCEVVIVEASLLNPNNLLIDIVTEMRDLGFAVYDLFGLSPRPYDGALGQVDICFVKEESPLRSYRHWQ